MFMSFFNLIRESWVLRQVRGKISKWPWYQSGPQQSLLSHHLKMKTRVILSFMSDSILMGNISRKRISDTKKREDTENCPVLVIGSGPSAGNLTRDQYMRFKNAGGKVLVMNSFVDSPLMDFVIPDYYILMDMEFWNPVHESELIRLGKIEKLLSNSSNTIIFIQHANQRKLFEEYDNYLFYDGRTTAGVKRQARPDKPWGLAGSVALMAIATLKYLGHSTIYFTGLDSDASRHYFLNDLNELIWDSRTYYFYLGENEAERRETKVDEGVFKLPGGLINNFYDLLHSDAIFRRDLMWLMSDRCVNVGGDRTNDAAPRACLL
jgi:hypothetical protein